MAEDSPKVKATKQRITATLMSRLADEPIDHITVGEVCGLAHINRSTFYNHFTDIYDVRDQCEQEVAAAVERVLPVLIADMVFDSDDLNAADVEMHIGPYCHYLDVLLNGGDPAFPNRMKRFARETVTALLPTGSLTVQQEYAFNAIASMQLGLISYWLSSGRSLSVEELLELIRQLIRNGPRAALIEG